MYLPRTWHGSLVSSGSGRRLFMEKVSPSPFSILTNVILSWSDISSCEFAYKLWKLTQSLNISFQTDPILKRSCKAGNLELMPPLEFLYEDITHCNPDKHFSCSAVMPSLPLTMKWLRDCVGENPSLRLQVSLIIVLGLVFGDKACEMRDKIKRTAHDSTGVLSFTCLCRFLSPAHYILLGMFWSCWGGDIWQPISSEGRIQVSFFTSNPSLSFFSDCCFHGSIRLLLQI